MVGTLLLGRDQGWELTWVCGGGLSLTNSALMLAMVSSWELQVIVGRSWRAQVSMERALVIRLAVVRDGWERYE